MVEHMVCFKMKPGTTAEHETRLIQMLLALKETVPSIVDLTAGRTTIPERGHGYTVGLVVRLPDQAALDAYQIHPEHVKVKEYGAQVCESTLAIDYEF